MLDFNFTPTDYTDYTDAQDADIYEIDTVELSVMAGDFFTDDFTCGGAVAPWGRVKNSPDAKQSWKQVVASSQWDSITHDPSIKI
jgi:hypothetical protein